MTQGNLSLRLDCWGDEAGAKKDYSKNDLVFWHSLGRRMGTAIKAIFGAILAVVVFLVAYGYVVDFAPNPVAITQPLVLNAQ